MRPRNLNEDERQMIVNVLYLAAKEWREIAAPELGDTFERQAQRALKLADTIEQADTITIVI